MSTARDGQTTDNADQPIDLTPMLDVVFIMLIFFIVTATFIKEPGIDVQRPPAETLARIPQQKIFIALSDSDEIWIDQQRVKPASVKGAIERLLAENSLGAVVIQADRNSRAQTFARVFDAARNAGVPASRIYIATVDD